MDAGKGVVIVGIDESEHSMYALEWTLDRFFPSCNLPFKLLTVHAKPLVNSDLSIEKAKLICQSKSVKDVTFEVAQGDPRQVLCEAVDKHVASILVIGSHGYGAIKRAVLGSVSDYCSHHAHCTVMIVKKHKLLLSIHLYINVKMKSNTSSSAPNHVLLLA